MTAIQIEGNLIAPDMTSDILAGDIKGQTTVDFGLPKTEKLEDEITLAWGEARDHWSIFQRRLTRLQEGETATSLTREYWAIPLLKLLGYDPIYQAKAEVVENQTYAISHRAEAGENKPPVHIIGSHIRLEQRPPSGTPRLSAHALVQEYLNRTEHLWAIVTNGLRWRLLRDSSLMTRLTYIEFDLEQIFNGENFADFRLFYRLFHRSRLPENMDDADKCLLEFYHQEALQQGGRVRDRLRDGVEQALSRLGTGFLQHPANEELRQKFGLPSPPAPLPKGEGSLLSSPPAPLPKGEGSLLPSPPAPLPKGEGSLLSPFSPREKGLGDEGNPEGNPETNFYRQLLLLIYRLLFLMVAESRNLLLAGEDPENVRIYRDYYSIERLRALAERPTYSREGFHDVWEGLKVTFALFDENWRGEVLGLSPLNGDLFGQNTLQDLNDSAIDNHDLLLALRDLSLYEQRGLLRRVNYGALDVEELGSVYESLLDFTPKVVSRQGIYEFQLVAGSERKTTGSYYTPPELVGQLIKSALDPVIEDALTLALSQRERGQDALALSQRERGQDALALSQRERGQEVEPSPPNPLSPRERGQEEVEAEAIPPLAPRERGTGGEGKPQRRKWDVPRELQEKMRDIARQFRKEPTRSEHILWQALRNRQLNNYKFRRQHPIGSFIVDFFCNEAGLIVEIDGSVHDTPEQQKLDRQRQKLLESLGLRFVRVRSEAVERDLPGVLETLTLALSQREREQEVEPSPPNPLSPRERGTGGEGSAQEQALLSLKICDPACGSGHFLLAAARRVGKELARIRTGEPQPSPEPLRQAIRDVIQNCIYGVDLNPLAVDLCKVALWIEGFCKGYPLNFLDHRIKCGNSLVGVLDMSCLHEGIPDNAYKPVTGDEKKVSTAVRKDNKKQRGAIEQGQLSMFDTLEDDRSLYAQQWRELGEIPETTTDEVKRKQAQYQASHSENNPKWWRDVTACNLWTAAFFMPLTEQNLQLLPTTEALHRLLNSSPSPSGRGGQGVRENSSPSPSGRGGQGVREIVEEANELARKHRFFHWCLEFPEVFGGESGFDCVLGNPPWERIKLQEKEFFADKDEAIAKAKNKAARTKLIKKLPETNPALMQAWEDAKHFADAQSKFVRESGRFPLTAFGDINTYAVFSETTRKVMSANGRVGVIVPTGIATDNTCKDFFGDLTQTQSLANLYDFENREAIFSDVHRSYKFSLLGMSGKPVEQVNFSFFLTQATQVQDKARVFQLSPSDIALMNPNTLTCPVFRTRADAEITKKIYQRVPVLENEATENNPWGISFMRMFDMSNDSHLFKNEAREELVSLYEAKLFWYYNHRLGDYADYPEDALTSHLPEITVERLQDPHYTITPRYWVEYTEVENRLENWQKGWLLCFRGICRSTDERTAVFTILPKVGIGNSAPVMLLDTNEANLVSCLQANLSSLVFDFVTRQKVGGANFNFFIVKQLPVIPPETYTQADIDYITPRVLELTYTAWDMQPFAQDIWQEASDEMRQTIRQQWQTNRQQTPLQSPLASQERGLGGEVPPPFIWNEQRRAILRAELDAKFAKLYGLTRDELRYILDPADIHGEDFPSETFRVLKNKEIKKYGEYRTQRLVLAAWDMMG